MNERYFRDCDLLVDKQPDIGATARLAEHVEPAGGEYPQEVAGVDDNVCGAGVRRSLYDQGPISAELPLGTVLEVRHRNRALFGDRDFDWRAEMRGLRVND